MVSFRKSKAPIRAAVSRQSGAAPALAPNHFNRFASRLEEVFALLKSLVFIPVFSLKLPEVDFPLVLLHPIPWRHRLLPERISIVRRGWMGRKRHLASVSMMKFSTAYWDSWTHPNDKLVSIVTDVVSQYQFSKNGQWNCRVLIVIEFKTNN